MKELQHLSNLWAHTVDASDPDDKCQFGFRGYIEVASFSCHPSHSNFSSVHLPVFLVLMLSFFINKLPPCLSCIFWANFFLRRLILSSAKFFRFFLRVSSTMGTFFLLFCTLHGSSWERAVSFSELNNFYWSIFSCVVLFSAVLLFFFLLTPFSSF